MEKLFVALARVSSREQEKEGWSIGHQIDELNGYAGRNGGKIVKLFQIAETATRSDERKTFRELIEYTLGHKAEIDGMLFYKVDRAARNLFDYVELERLEFDHEIPFISTSQPTDNLPSGRLARRMLAVIAAFYTEQQSIDVRDGHKRRVEAGLFLGLAPYGYRNVRINMRGLIEVDLEEAKWVIRIFCMYAYENLTPDMMIEKLAAEGSIFTPKSPRWLRNKIYDILRDRSYIGEVFYQGIWYPGVHAPLVDKVTFDRVQVLLGDKVYRAHELTYGSELIRCGHCGAPVTGEAIKKPLTGKVYTYYRCSKYTKAGHPRVRVTEGKLDEQVISMLSRLRQPDPVCEWFKRRLQVWNEKSQQQNIDKAAECQRDLNVLRNQQDRLVNGYTLGHIDGEQFSKKNTEFRDRIAATTLRLESVDRRRDEQAELAIKVFELSQNVAGQWVTANYAAKRRILEIVCLNFSLVDVSLVPTWRKPFDMLAEGLVVFSNRGDRI
ncbi:MAG TPA: recombinase family protein [Tepidisphaeraceae bacterium]|nr:recombinase family protein [Tepidisphaeraceae bacterium]